MKAGWIISEAGTSDPLLRWDVGGVIVRGVNWDAGIWHNVAYATVSAYYHFPSERSG